ncbi:MAG: hypothetical protein EA376_01990 [Phycisphaeraceae bacterium]|nr:MAG: hypothetical protein EA376_01990 [Phycisphaeraceae bacterium]
MKSCALCGGDVENTPRLKDSKGRYMHRACYERAMAAKSSGAGIASGSGAAAASGADAGILPIQPSDRERARACPSCNAMMEGLARLCIACGYNLDTGRRAETMVNASGAAVDVTDDSRRQSWAGAMRKDVFNAIVIFVVTMIGALVVLEGTEGTDGVITYLVIVPLEIGLTIAAIFICALMWLSPGRPWLLTSLRLAAVVSTVSLAQILIGLALPSFFFIALASLVLQAALLAWALEIEFGEAILVAIITIIIKIILAITLASLVLSRF